MSNENLPPVEQGHYFIYLLLCLFRKHSCAQSLNIMPPYYSALLSISNRARGHCDKQSHEVAPEILDLHRHLHPVESPPPTRQSAYSVFAPCLG